MTSTHSNWLRFAMGVLALGASLTETATVWAQGFGPDPFRPYNSQYDPYVYPIGPAGPGAGQNAPMNVGGSRANQYQSFLDELQGPSISNGERYGIGQPYYRSTVDPSYVKHYRPDYLPRVKTERSFEETQRLINEKYFAYFEEKDPKKRARLLREYQQVRTLATRKLSARREDTARLLEAITLPESDPRSTVPGRSTDRLSPTSRSDIPASPKIRSGYLESSRRSSSRSAPTSPSLPFDSSTRTGTRRTASPTDLLNRARNLEMPTDGQSRPAAKGEKDRRTSSVPPSPSPSRTND